MTTADHLLVGFLWVTFALSAIVVLASLVGLFTARQHGREPRETFAIGLGISGLTTVLIGSLIATQLLP